MNSIKKIGYGIAMTLLIISTNLFAQKSDEKITEQQKQLIINNAMKLLKENYIFPDRVSPIEASIKKKYQNKEYATLNTVIEFIRKITEDLEAVGKDHHLGIFYGPEWVMKIKSSNNSNGTNNTPKQFLEMINYDNFGLRKVERIEGNIGYFNFVRAEGLEYSKDAIVGAMNFIAHSDAVIIDIRQNHGFSAEMVLFLESYFLPDSTKVGTFKRRINNETIDLYTTADAAIKKVPASVPLFIVVDNKTSSGAEALAYDLQQFKRAVIIGEPTLGEANPGKRFAVNDQLWMMIPTATSSNAVSGKNWEQVGVIPDIKMGKDKALQLAILEASKAIALKTKIKMQRQMLNWQVPVMEKELYPQQTSPEFIHSIIGNYERNQKIVYENEVLYFTTPAGKFKMEYLGKNIFEVKGKDYRFLFPTSTKPVSSFQAVWDDEGTEEIKRISN